MERLPIDRGPSSPAGLLAERIKALPAMPERLNIPYNFKEILDLAERAERMTPETWNRVIAFAQAAGGK